MDERLLRHYEDELRHIRETAGEFAREFDKIAGRLSLDKSNPNVECPDPYVERLLEGFAFLSARVHLKLDAEFPRFTQGLLETVYPDYLCPVPSACIVRFVPAEGDGSLAPGFPVPRGTRLRSLLGRGERTPCTFTTAHPVRLLPVTLTEAQYFTRDLPQLNLPAGAVAKSALRLRLRKTVANPWAEVRLAGQETDERTGAVRELGLTVHLPGGDAVPAQIYELIFAHATGVAIQNPEGSRTLGLLPRECIRRVGYSPQESMLPLSPRGFDGYRLLREYFALPQRLLFFELTGFGPTLSKAREEELDLVILFGDTDVRLEGRVARKNFELFCTPAINLFSKELDPIPLNDRMHEFPLYVDRNRPLDYEIYKIEEEGEEMAAVGGANRVRGVVGFGRTHQEERRFRPFYLARDADIDAGAYYTLHRVQRLLGARERDTGQAQKYAGSDVFLSLVDANNAPYHPDLKTLAVRALCTNRHLPIQMPVDKGPTDFTIVEASPPVTAVRVVAGPTRPRPSLAEGRFAWRLISHLSLNYLSLLDSDARSGAQALRELLNLYVEPNDRPARRQIEGLRHVSTKPVIRRLATPGPIAFARGLEITIRFDEGAFEGTSAFVLGSVMEEFFSRYVSLNSFTETVVESETRGQLIRWPAHLGRRQLI